MARRVFFSFYYKADCTRAAKIRNIGVLEGNEPASDNEWESIWKGGDPAIEAWIDGQMKGRTCTVVLIGSETAGRRWINYEIKKSWRNGKGLLGIYVHNVPDLPNLQTSYKGANPFDKFILSQDGCTLSDYASRGGPLAQVGLGGSVATLVRQQREAGNDRKPYVEAFSLHNQWASIIRCCYGIRPSLHGWQTGLRVHRGEYRGVD